MPLAIPKHSPFEHNGCPPSGHSPWLSMQPCWYASVVPCRKTSERGGSFDAPGFLPSSLGGGGPVGLLCPSALPALSPSLKNLHWDGPLITPGHPGGVFGFVIPKRMADSPNTPLLLPTSPLLAQRPSRGSAMRIPLSPGDTPTDQVWRSLGRSEDWPN